MARIYRGLVRVAKYDMTMLVSVIAVMVLHLGLVSMVESYAQPSDNATLPSAEMMFSRDFQIAGPLPVVNEYVRYELAIKNTGSQQIEGQQLWVSFTSDTGRVSNSFAAFTLGTMPPGESKTLFLGPFKMREPGNHFLYIGINSQGNSSLPNEVLLNYEPGRAIDSFTAYESSLVRVLPIAITLILGGAGIIVGLYLYHRRKAKRLKDIK